ncbi:Cell division protein FtsL [Marinobacterium sp. xm-a-121]|jgi:cell division protein FtsL|nr:Cell division protein FtsL [Marinobacterium sp. xm-g-48]NRP15593.1 Cell division protein FtsL [Marinobacterium sp. xm-a-152]NRP27713.1 Cell division protein FtsL [Marinobacterium sp. xm-d-420]NRP38293.1 Cell division protein FtsL [Marinobacterium sp. xm-a-121]NRP47076.1 Cell division protein FtsL [Marinobacterium sp. xm-d-543]NRP53213.1 Cell division protein FtsL [Marinobacterium sp. xm-v-242]NRP57436.1 Cell division protein FtsL [Marinobacterium sp. xm-d-510]NRP59930.1 Cell division prot
MIPFSIPFKDRLAIKQKPKQQTKELPMLELGQLFAPLVSGFLLIAFIFISALAVIYTAYDYRRLFNQHQVLVRQSDELRIEWGQLLLEQSAWGANNRVEVLAEQRLGMKMPKANEIRLAIDE